MTATSAAATTPPRSGHGRDSGHGQAGGHADGGGRGGSVTGMRWVLDPDDAHSCMRALLGLHDPAGGVVATPAAVGSPWPVLARDLLLALGKDRRALAAAGSRRRAPELLAVWLRAEQVRHVVVLRAHLLPPETLVALVSLAVNTRVQVWAVAHAAVPAPVPAAPTAAIHWTDAFALLNEHTADGLAPANPDEVYETVRDLARRAGRTWRLYTERTLVRPLQVRPGCTLGTLLQNLTIDAHDSDDLRLRLHASRSGLRDEGLHLALPALEDDPRLLGYLGPRFTPDTVARLRRLACPIAAGALTLALATDNNAAWLATTQLDWTDPDARHVRSRTGTFRIPPQARPMLRALLLDRTSRTDPPPTLLVGRDGAALHGRRTANLIGGAADLTGLRAGEAAVGREKRYTPENFATPFTGATSIRPLTEADAPPT